MAYDPNKPMAGAPLDAAEMRAQLNGLADLITTNAAGPVDSVAPLDSFASVADVVDKINEMLTRLKRQ